MPVPVAKGIKKQAYCVMCQQTKGHSDFEHGLDDYRFLRSGKEEGIELCIACRKCYRKWGKLPQETKRAYIVEGCDRCIGPGQVVYKLTDPETGEIKYIGRTNNPKRRMKSHCKDLRSDPWCPPPAHGEPFETRGYWMWKLKQKGIRPSMDILFVPDTAVYIHEWEQRYIYHGLQSGWPLTNMEAMGYAKKGGVGHFQHIDFLADPFEKLLEVGFFKENRIESFMHKWYELEI